MQRMMTEEQLEFYRENGFVQVDDVFTAEEIDELAGAMEEAMVSEGVNSIANGANNSSYSKVLNQKVNVWRDHGIMSKYSLHARTADIARQLSGASGIRLFHDHALWKMPNDSKPTPWHQDMPYWPMNEPGALSVWIPVDDVDERNGCMMFVPGSHKVGKLTGISLTNPQNLFEFAQGTGIEERQPVVVPLKKGSCTFHHGLTFHYAHANLTDKPRRVLAVIYMPDGTTYTGKKHIVTENAGLTVNEPIRGGTFPLLAK
ncbi:phytanoyl-CoA dioxygenase family protein [Paenibacillus hodogayensis]|uniref:Phytanoyl-CoA dioxygenase family protein n=1 Tax=Paenibacillus hodogayensis TaxID=279208 RepID=A0ABV5VYE6_9BACL